MCADDNISPFPRQFLRLSGLLQIKLHIAMATNACDDIGWNWRVDCDAARADDPAAPFAGGGNDGAELGHAETLAPKNIMTSASVRQMQ